MSSQQLVRIGVLLFFVSLDRGGVHTLRTPSLDPSVRMNKTCCSPFVRLCSGWCFDEARSSFFVCRFVCRFVQFVTGCIVTLVTCESDPHS